MPNTAQATSERSHVAALPAPFTSLRLHPLGCPAGVDPSVWREALRQRIEDNLATVDALIAALDEMTPDPDLEPFLADTHGDDREGGDVQDEPHDPGGDDEPSLGWTDMEARWGRHAGTFDPDLELDDLDTGEADYAGWFGGSGFADAEPSAGYDHNEGDELTAGGTGL